MEVGDRGRLSPDVLVAWQTAHNAGTTATRPEAAKKRATASKPAPGRQPPHGRKTTPALKPASVETPPSPGEPTPAAEPPATVARLLELERHVAALAARIEHLERQAAEPPRRRGLLKR